MSAGGGGDASFCSNPFIKLAMRLLLGATGGLLAMTGLPGRGGFGLEDGTGFGGTCFSISFLFLKSDGFKIPARGGFSITSFSSECCDFVCSCGDPPPLPLLALLPVRNLFLAWAIDDARSPPPNSPPPPPPPPLLWGWGVLLKPGLDEAGEEEPWSLRFNGGVFPVFSRLLADNKDLANSPPSSSSSSLGFGFGFGCDKGD